MRRVVGSVRQAFSRHEAKPSASLASRMLSHLLKCIHNSIDAQLNHRPFLVREENYFEKIGVFAVRILPITRHRRNCNIDLTKLFTWKSMRSALAVSDSSGLHVLPRKLWLVCIGTTDNNSIARKALKQHRPLS